MFNTSKGSSICSPTCLVITWGRETANSNPSLRIVSINIDRCSSPRPETLKQSGSSVSSTNKATLWEASVNNLSRICLLVKYLPSLPAKGEVFTLNSIVNVGSSTVRAGSGSTESIAHKVSEMPISSIPETQTISPAIALSRETVSSPL